MQTEAQFWARDIRPADFCSDLGRICRAFLGGVLFYCSDICLPFLPAPTFQLSLVDSWSGMQLILDRGGVATLKGFR